MKNLLITLALILLALVIIGLIIGVVVLIIGAVNIVTEELGFGEIADIIKDRRKRRKEK